MRACVLPWVELLLAGTLLGYACVHVRLSGVDLHAHECLHVTHKCNQVHLCKWTCRVLFM